MKELDFRPDWYRALRRRRRTTVIRVVLLGILAAELVVGSLGVYTKKAIARQDIDGLRKDFERQVAVFKDLDEKLSLLEQLRRKHRLLSDVGGGAPTHRMLAELARAMPEDVVLTRIRLVQQRSIDGVETGAATGPEAGQGGAEAGRVELNGWAATDVSVGTLMTNMAKSELFRDVVLSYSQPAVINRRVAREFKLTCVFPQFE